ncbi:YheV family putative zinc ribbon protein [Vibrio rumoiensis]|uniref:Metal-binding protein n=1 Tax=Vibrio rumoiensis 1S-45 TaxID=1188252 RepID=A0A1E5E6H0_9VIBR|nr:YheV family putative zinc ribbon protein [Vibrio rumoiensis]OEF30096.1 metal-binding protein [Vibrio rumoiensis 1S-45]
MKTKKRFIAGASCPMCKQADSLRVWEENQIEVVECVECDYVEQKTPEKVEKSPRASEQMIGIFKPD